MLTPIIALLLAATPTARLPANPSQFWIWSSRGEASSWKRTHPSLCISRVPDGWATHTCKKGR